MYKYEFFDPAMSFDEEVIAMLQQKQKETAEKAEPQKKLELKEAYNLLGRIDVKLNEETADDDPRPSWWTGKYEKSSPHDPTDVASLDDPELDWADLDDEDDSVDVPTGTWRQASATVRPRKIPRAPAATSAAELREPREIDPGREEEKEAPGEEVDYDDMQDVRSRYEKSYSDPGGINRKIYVKALADPSHPLGKFDGDTEAATKYYEREVLPRVWQALSTPTKDPGPELFVGDEQLGQWMKRQGVVGAYSPLTKTIYPEKQPRGVAGHELGGHATSYQIPKRGDPTLAIAQKDLIRQTLGMKDVEPPRVPGQTPSFESTEEMRADIKKHHVDAGHFTAERLNDIKNGNYRDSDGYSYRGVRRALRDAETRGVELDLEKVAKGLNRVAARDTGRPLQAIAESRKRRKIRIRLKKKR